MTAQIPRASLSPHREVSPFHFSQPDHHPSASASDLVLFGGSDEELADDSMSCQLSGSVTDPALLPSPASSAAKAGMDAKLLHMFSQKRLKSWDWSGLHQRSPLAAAWTSGSCRGAMLECKSCPPVQAMQDHFSARWMLLHFSWSSSFTAPLYGGPPGLSGQIPFCHGRLSSP